MGRRRQAREIALQALYIMDTSGTPMQEAFAIVNRREEKGDEKTLEFALELVTGTTDHRPALDKLIEGAAQNWALSRMAAVDRNVLRLSAYELLHRPDTPINVVIDEAIEIVRKYSTEDSTRFINGILDKLKDQRPGHERPPEARR
jgi:transcription antitermination protein NusB